MVLIIHRQPWHRKQSEKVSFFLWKIDWKKVEESLGCTVMGCNTQAIRLVLITPE